MKIEDFIRVKLLIGTQVETDNGLQKTLKNNSYVLTSTESLE